MKKSYVIGNKTLTQSELSLNDGKKMLTLLKGIDWNGFVMDKQSMYDVVSSYLDQNVLEQLFAIILKGEMPDGEIGDWMTANLAGEVVADFLELNDTLTKRLLTFLISSKQSESQVPNSEQ
jgi:hypothetical protein